MAPPPPAISVAILLLFLLLLSPDHQVRADVTSTSPIQPECSSKSVTPPTSKPSTSTRPPVSKPTSPPPTSTRPPVSKPTSPPPTSTRPPFSKPTSPPPTSKPPGGGGSGSSVSSGFLSTLQSTIDEIQKLVSIISTFTGVLGGDLRLSSAITDCLDLLDLSADELTWSLSVSQPSAATSSPGGTGNHPSDLRSWLSAALGNQDTCKEGLDSSSSMLGSLVGSGLEAVTSLVSDGLRQVVIPGRSDFGGQSRRRLLGGFPEWVGPGDRRRLLQQQVSSADAVVAKDGSGNYTTVSAAVAAAPAESERRYVIYVKRGVYQENVEIKKKKWNVMIVGDGMDATVISAKRSFVDGWTTYRSATFAVSGKGFIARDVTFENTAGPEKHQAVALRSDSDLSVFYRVGVRAYQDSLYAHALRQFYRECRISGTVDFIFGNAAAVFQSCQILARKPLPEQKNSVTAQGRKDPNQNTGFSIQFCNITADADLTNQTATQTYLGRPWKEYSRTVVMQSYLGSAIRPEGWLAWQGDFALSTLYYAEYMNSGPGSGLSGRVKWPGYHAVNNPAQVLNFTVSQFIDGNLWLPPTGVKYTAGLTM